MPLRPSLRCLGSPVLYGENGEPVRFRVKKHLALLTFLAVEPRVHRRDRMAELLWPGGTAQEGRHSLATALSILRAKLGRGALDARRDTVRLLPGTVELDLDRLAAGEVLGSDTVPPLQVAPFLEEFEVPDAPGWNQWRDAQTAHWQPAIRDALLTLIDRSRRHGDTRAMERLADSLLSIDALSEEGIRSKMEARAFAGDRLSALRIFEEWKECLADEVGAQPGDLVEGMAVRLRRRGWERTGKEHIAPVHTDQWKDRPFIGRGLQYRTLYEGWEGTEQGKPRHAVITGDSGVGKTTLAERLSTAAGLQGAVTAREQCHEVERDVPYAALGGLVVGLLDKPGANAIAPEWLGELGRTVGEVRRRFPNAPPPMEAQGETVRIRIADAFVELVLAVAEEQPVILILDDLHLADDASVTVVHLLLRRLTDQRVLVLLTARPGEIAAGGNAQKLLDRADQVGLVPVTVSPLTPDESGELVDSLLASRSEKPSPPARRALLRAAAGYPMVLELLVNDWDTHGERCLALALEGMTEETGAESGPGTMYRRILERLAAELDPAALNALNLAAVLGSRLNDFALYGLADLTVAQTMAGLSRLAALRILRDAGQGLEFINELMRAQAYLAIPSSIRKVLHGRVADRLIERSDQGEAMLGLEVAWHCVRAGRKEESARYLISGADEAIEQGAHVNAERALLTAIPNLKDGVREQAQYRLALVLQDQGRWEESRKQIQDFRLDASEAVALDAQALLATANLLIESRFGLPLPSSAKEVLQISATHPNPHIQVRAISAVASYVDKTHDYEVATRAIQVANILSNVRLARGDQASGQIALAQLCWALRYYSRTMSHLEQADALVDPSLVNSPLRLRIELGLGSTFCALGEFSTAIPHLQRAATIGAHIGSDIAIVSSLANLALCSKRRGNYEEQLVLARRATRMAPGTHVSYLTATTLYHEAFALAMLHREAEALAAIASNRTNSVVDPRSWVAQAWKFWTADIAWLCGRENEALDSAKAGLLMGEARPLMLGLTGPFCRWYALSATRGHDVTIARSALTNSLTHLADFDVPDQLEVVLAAHLASVAAADVPNDLMKYEIQLRTRLPQATIHQISRLGLPT